MTFDELRKLAVECRDEAAAQALLRNVEGCRWEFPYQPGLQGDARVVIAGLRVWLRAPLPGEIPWPDASVSLIGLILLTSYHA